MPSASLRLYYLQEQRRAEQRRRKNPYNFQMTSGDLRASHVFYICPRPVVLVSVEHEGSANLFPMDLIGPTDSPWFSMALRSTSPAVRLMQQSRRMALAGTPFAYRDIAYALGKHHQLSSIDWATLPFPTTPSPLFHLPVPAEALRVREVSVTGISRSRLACVVPDFGGKGDHLPRTQAGPSCFMSSARTARATMFKMRPPGKSGLAAGLLGLVFAAATLLWLRLDRAPPNWDDAWYLTNSLTVYDALTQGGLPGYLAKLNSVLGFKAPLIAALPAPFYLLLGRHWHAAFLVNIASMWVLFAALYRIARRWWNARAAVFAIAIAGTMPLLYGLARWFMVEYALTALVAAAICVLIESDGLKRDGHSVLFGALCGFGLLLKVSFPLFVLPALVYAWVTSGRRVRPLLWIALPCVLLAAPLVCRASAADAGECARCGFRCSCGNSGHRPHLLAAHHFHVPFACRVDWRLVLLRRASAVGGCGSGDSTQWKESTGAADCMDASVRDFSVWRKQGRPIHRTCAAGGGAGAGVVAGFRYCPGLRWARRRAPRSLRFPCCR